MGKIIAALLLSSLTVTVYDTPDLTAEILETRAPNTLIVERFEGVVVDAEGNGQHIDNSNFYISYYRLGDKLPAPGTEVVTYLVYNPMNNAIDDIIYRIDFIQ